MTVQQESMIEQNHLALAVAALLAIASLPAYAQSSDGIPGVMAPGVVPELMQEGFVFTEGPVGTADGALYFSDIRVSKTFYLDASGKISIVRENTNGANGLALTRDGELLFAEGDGKRITKRNKDGSITTVTEGPTGVPLLAPNDLLVDSKGGIYFTDPGPRPVVPGRPTYVYYLPSGARQPILLDGNIARPNGLTLTGDGKALIVDDTLNPTVFAYDVQSDGSVKNKRAFTQLRDVPAGSKAVQTVWPSTAMTVSTSRRSLAFKCLTPRASTSEPSRSDVSPPTPHLPALINKRFISQRERAFTECECSPKGWTAWANEA